MAWMETSTPLGARQLKSSATGRCLDSNHDGAVYTLPCDANNPYQNWRFDPNSEGRIQNFATNHCLDSNHARQVYATPCQENNLHQWWG
jgi:serine/threonine-protein kinase